MHVYRHAVIRFGRTEDTPDGVTIPVGLSTAVSEAEEIEFKTLHAECEQPINKQNYCTGCGKEATETLKGYEIVKGQFVVFTEEELNAAKPPRSSIIELVKFVERGQISPLMIEKHTYLVPNQLKAGDYGALYQVLVSGDTAGFGSQALFGKEHPCAVYALHGALVMGTLNLEEQLRLPDFAPEIPNQETRNLIAELVDLQSGVLASENLVSPSKEYLLSLIRAKQEGQELPVPTTESVRQIVDIQETLKASIAAAKRAKKPVRKTKTAK